MTMRAEEVRANFKKLRISVKPFSSTQTGIKSITMVPITPGNPHTQVNPDDTYEHLINTPKEEITRWETILDQEDIKRHLLEYKRSFRAAAETPCGHSTIVDAITFTATSQAAREFTQGIIPAEWFGDKNLLHEFLKSFFAPSDILNEQSPISTKITKEDLIYGFRKWKESTSTSPSGCHLGHYRAIIQNNIRRSKMVHLS
jgi:hypothetical protein